MISPKLKYALRCVQMLSLFLFGLSTAFTLHSTAFATGETGSLSISITGLPSGTSASVKIWQSGSGYQQTITESTTLTDLPVGTYLITAYQVTNGSTVYLSSPTSQTQEVAANTTTSTSVVYQAAGTLDVTVNPSTITADIDVSAANGHYDVHLTGSKTLTDLPPSVYTLTAHPVKKGKVTLVPSPEVSIFNVASGQTVKATVNYVLQSQVTGALIVAIDPSDITANVTVTGPSYQKTVTTTTTLTGLKAGDYTIHSETVTSKGCYYTPASSDQTLTISTSRVAKATVTYTCTTPYIPDPLLEDLIRTDSEVNKPTGDLTFEDLEKLTDLSTSSIASSCAGSSGENPNKIKTIEGLQYAANLETLVLWCQDFSDLSPLSGLSKLWYLMVDYTPVTSLTPLTPHALQFTCLSLSDTQISDLSLLAQFTNLRMLTFSYSYFDSQASDISFLKGLTNITFLSMSQNQIDDLSPIQGMNSFSYLNINTNPIQDLSVLSGKSIDRLEMYKTPVEDISALETISNVNTLRLQRNLIRDITPLVNNAEIDSGDDLDLRYNCLDLTNPTTMSNLQALSNRGVEVTYEPQDSCLTSTGNLYVTIAGLPYGIPGNVSVNGATAGYSTTVSDTTLLKDLPPDTYQIVADTVLNGTLFCTGDMTTATVKADETTTVTVTYVCIDTDPGTGTE